MSSYAVDVVVLLELISREGLSRTHAHMVSVMYHTIELSSLRQDILDSSVGGVAVCDVKNHISYGILLVPLGIVKLVDTVEPSIYSVPKTSKSVGCMQTKTTSCSSN